MRHAWGIHLANGPMDLGKWVDLIGNGCYTLLSDQGNVLPDLRQKAPEALILVRMYIRDWYNQVSPEGWAANCLEFYLKNRQYTRHLTWANEQNLSAESGGSLGAPDNPVDVYLYRTIADWNERFITYFRNHGGADAILHYPAFATGHSDDQNDYGFVGLAECARGINMCEILDRHYYPELGKPVEDDYQAGRVKLAEALFPNKPIFISEFANFQVENPGTADHLVKTGYYWQGDPHILGFTGFIADDPTGAHQSNCWSKNQMLLDAYKNTVRTEKPRQDVVPTLPAPMPPTGWDIGTGLRKCVPILGNPKQSEIYHFKELPDFQTSLAVFEQGYATWNPITNETTAYRRTDKSVWRDGGNNAAFSQGKMKLVSQIP